MMKKIKGPAIFLAQFLSDEAPFNEFRSLCKWAASLGYIGVQVPTNVPSIFDLEKATKSKDYCDELIGIAKEEGIVITELSTHLQGQLVAVHPAYDLLFDNFAPDGLKGKPKERTEWAVQQLKWAATASRNLGIDVHGTFSGALIWHTVYPWPQRPQGLVETAFGELAKRWRPILDEFDHHGVDVCYELHPGEDLHDGLTFERFLEAVDDHPRANILYDPSHMVLQGLKYLDFIDFYHDRIRMFHAKDAELNPTGKAGVYGGFAGWVERPGRFRSLGDGQVDFKGIFSKLSQYGYDGWAVLEWEDCIKSAEQGAAEGAPFIASHIIEVTEKAFDDFAGGEPDQDLINRVIGL